MNEAQPIQSPRSTSVDDTPPFSSPAPLSTYAASSPHDLWLIVFAGFVAAEIACYLLCKLPAPHTRIWLLFLRSIAYVLVTMTAGSLGILFAWSRLGRKPAFSPATLIQLVGIGWLFFAWIALLYRESSPLILVAVAIASFLVALSVNRLAAAIAEPSHIAASDILRDVLPSLDGLPSREFHPAYSFLMAVCLQGAVALAADGSPLLASAALSLFIFLAVSRWTALTGGVHAAPSSANSRIRLVCFAVLLTFSALLLWSSGAGQVRSPHPGLFQKSSPRSSDPSGGNNLAGFVGIILLPPPVKKTAILPPTSHIPSSHLGHLAEPVIIPFDGPYWYFKAPRKQPGAAAHTAHAKPTEVNVHSTDREPLIMQARQDLNPPIDLDCCRAIDITLHNADTRPGQIALDLLLTDSKSPGAPSLSLGDQLILSTQPPQIPLDRPPVTETLHFSIPPSKLKRFDRLTIIFLPVPTRARTAAKISIQSFTLIPR